MNTTTPHRRISPYLSVPAVLYVLHACAVYFFAVTQGHFKGPDADAGSMIWIAWVFFDFPLGIPVLFLAEWAPTNAGAIAIVAFVGGIQWIVWGVLVACLVDWIQHRSDPQLSQQPPTSECRTCHYDLRGTPNGRPCPECGHVNQQR